ncbi:MAG: rhodanese-like domain-containing protein [Bacteriovoracaceae bacterium]|nr:rhodanese-like domain-containing protein [Bacteriovoracaceae bacterium]
MNQSNIKNAMASLITGIVFICRSGARSGNATLEALKLGFKKPVNMTGGMLQWNEQKYSVTK